MSERVDSDAPATAEGPASYSGASQVAIAHHYDISNDFYGVWLDSTLTYSCGLWKHYGDTLKTAQQRKLDYLARASGAVAKKRVLDIGCGWGGMLRRLRGRHGVEHVVGLTLSEAQAASVSGWADSSCEVRVENWADHTPGETYDAILSVEAFEHFAAMGMSRTARVGAYREFFARCHEWLPRHGRLVLQTSAKGNNMRLEIQTVRDMRFIVDRIFPESELPWASEILQASEHRFDVVSARNDPEDYVRTLGEWLARLRRNRLRAEGMLGEEVVADYERYLGAAADAFANRHLGLMRIIFERV